MAENNTPNQSNEPPKYKINTNDKFNLLDSKEKFLIFFVFFIFIALISGKIILLLFILLNIFVLIFFFRTSFIHKYGLLPINIDKKSVFPAGSLKKKINLSILIVIELVLVSFLIRDTNFYQRYSFKSEVDDFVEIDSNMGMISYLDKTINSNSQDSILYLITRSFDMKIYPLKGSIERYESNLEGVMLDSVISLYQKNKVSYSTKENLGKKLFMSNFKPSTTLIKMMKTHPENNIRDYCFDQLMDHLSKLKTYNKEDHDTPTDYFKDLRYSDIASIRYRIEGFLNLFGVKKDSLWGQILSSLYTIDTTAEFVYENKVYKPTKPRLEKASFDRPSHLAGAVVPYDGNGLLVTDGIRFYLVFGVDRFPGYFNAYVDFTGETQTIVNYSNNSTWDARVCNFVGEDEYNERLEAYYEEVQENKEYYNKELAEYNKELISYNNFTSLIPKLLQNVIDEKNKIENAKSELKLVFYSDTR